MSGKRKRQWERADTLTRRMSVTSLLRFFTPPPPPQEFSPDNFPLQDAQDIWTYRGATCCIVHQGKRWEEELKMLRESPDADIHAFTINMLTGQSQNYNGYAIFKRRPLRERGYNGILTYAPVHGGITYARAFAGGEFCYGFDTAHFEDDASPMTKDSLWAKVEVERMVLAIQIARRFERRYIIAKSRPGKVQVLLAYAHVLKTHHVEYGVRPGLGLMINMLSGRL